MNVAAWERALTRAARRGYVSTSPSREPSSTTGTAVQSDHLILRTDDSLLRDLEIPEYGRPVALGAMLVCLSFQSPEDLHLLSMLVPCTG